MRSFFVYWTSFLFLGTGTAGGILVFLGKRASPGAREGLWLITDAERYELWKRTVGFAVPETPTLYGEAYAALFVVGAVLLVVRTLVAVLQDRKKS